MRVPIKTISLQCEIMKYIENYIEEEGLKSGEKLPSQAELAEMMNVSRTALREAVRTMEGQGILTVKNGKGVYVGGNFGKDLIQTTLTFHREKKQLAEALEVRAILEKAILKLVVSNVTDTEIQELGEITRILMGKFHAGEDKVKEDRAFHFKVYSFCHNEVMVNLMSIVTDMLHQFGDPPLDIENPFDAGIPYHEELYHAIQQRNLKQALQANEKIIENVRKEILCAEKK